MNDESSFKAPVIVVKELNSFSQGFMFGACCGVLFAFGLLWAVSEPLR